ncbi:MAG: hypothetical protein EXR08_03930 [Alphaproteobacteria bacterium]|nr:hypothetical protein [Alphaproteobacteria bacterium]
MPRIGVFKLFLGAALLFLGACAQKHVITNVNPLPLYKPSQVSYAARNGEFPVEVHGALPAGVSAAQLMATVHLPADFPGARLVLTPQPSNSGAPVQPVSSNPYGSLCLQRLLDSSVTQNGNSCHGPSRLVLVFNPDFRTPPGLACEAPDSIMAAGSQNVRVLAALCIGNRLASSGQVQVASAGDGGAMISSAINVLLMDILQPRARGGNSAQSNNRWH